MKNAMILVGLWVGIILAAYALVYVGGGGPTPGQLALLERLAERTYVEADGRFQFELPPGWRVEEQEDAVHLVGPIEKIEAWVVVVGAMDAEQAIRTACERVYPCPGDEITLTEELSPPAFATRKVKCTFVTEDESTFLFGIGIEATRETVILLVRGDLEVGEQRMEELTGIEESLTLPGVGAPTEIGEPTETFEPADEAVVTEEAPEPSGSAPELELTEEPAPEAPASEMEPTPEEP